MSESDNDLEIERQALLKDLKNTVEGLLISQVTNVWNVYGGLNRLHQAMEKIFHHRFKVFQPDSALPDCMVFIQGLDWLQPNSSSVSIESVYQPHMPSHLKSDKASIWLYRSLENHSLSQKLSWLVSDKEHLLSCYNSTAFLCQEKYCEATLICLKAVEQYQPCLLSEINPSLLLTTFELKGTRNHRRSSSFPTVGALRKADTSKKFQEKNNCLKDEAKKVPENVEKLIENLTDSGHKRKYLGKLKPWKSLPDLKLEVRKGLGIRTRSATISQYSSMQTTPMHRQLPPTVSSPQRKLSPSILQVDYSKIKVDTSQDNVQQVKPKKSPKIHKKSQYSVKKSKRSSLPQSPVNSSLKRNDLFSIKSLPINTLAKVGQIISGSDPEYSLMPLGVLGEKDLHRCPKKSFIEDGGSSIIPMATGYFPRPVQGQSLTSFLSSGQFSHTSAELDRENAHFSISEAMIAAIEQVKFNKRMKIECAGGESDEEDNNLRQRIRIRRKSNKKQQILNDSFSDSITVTPSSTSPESREQSPSTDDVDDLEVDSASNLVDSRSISASLASLYSDSDILKKPREAPDGQSDCVISAEGVALSLISKFKPKQLPKASELEWLVSESEVNQQLLPLPTSWPVNPDASVSPARTTPLRGTADWAPPRPQIISTPHPVPVRRTLMEKQQYRCAGCGMRVAVQYASKFRFCEYLGRYFCTGCHSNQLALIPGKILTNWDFKRYPVSNFSYRLLDQMSIDPLFNVGAVNPGLYKKIRQLDKCRIFRTQLFYLKNFVLSCRFAQKIKEHLQKENNYILSDPEVYSINDLCLVKKGEILLRLRELIELSLIHVNNCEFCRARGFICEFCSRGDIIFPWQLRKVTQCIKCGACAHRTCWSPTITLTEQMPPCKRCWRLKLRRESRQEEEINTINIVEHK